MESGSADTAYYNFIDRFDMLGIGKDAAATGNGSEALLALVDGKFMTFRVPYPMGFYAKGIDGRIDDPKGGWKGKGIWSTYATRAPFHAEGGKGTTSKLVKFQVRNSPLDNVRNVRVVRFVRIVRTARTIRTSRTIRTTCCCERCWPSRPPGLVAFLVPLLIAWPRVARGLVQRPRAYPSHSRHRAPALVRPRLPRQR